MVSRTNNQDGINLSRYRENGGRSAEPGDIAWADDEQNIRKIGTSAASAVFVASDVELPEPPTAAVIRVADPLIAFLQVLDILCPRRTRPSNGQSPHAVVHPSAVIGERTNIDPFAHIDEAVVIGDDCDVLPGAYIGPGCRLGNQVVVHPNAVLYSDVQIGDRVTIHASAVLGCDGFGYRQVDGRHIRIPHFGTVVIEDDVEIGAGTTIDRAKLGETRVGEGSKIDNLVLIAHNCRLGRHNLLAGQVGFAGSVTTGDYVVCGGQAGIADHVDVGDGCVLSARSGVHHSLEGGHTYMGAPVSRAEEARRQMIAIRRLPDLRTRVRELEKQLEELVRTITPSEDGSCSSRAA